MYAPAYQQTSARHFLSKVCTKGLQISWLDSASRVFRMVPHGVAVNRR